MRKFVVDLYVIFLLVMFFPGEIYAVSIGGVDMLSEGKMSFAASFAYVSRNLKVDSSNVYSKSSRFFFKATYGVTSDLNLYSRIGFSSFGDENLDSDLGLCYGVGARYYLMEYSNSKIPKIFGHYVTFLVDGQYFGFSTGGKSKNSHVKVDTNWNEANVSLEILGQSKQWDVYGALSIDLSRGSIEAYGKENVDFKEKNLLGFRLGGLIHANDHIKFWIEAGFLDEVFVGLGGAYVLGLEELVFF